MKRSKLQIGDEVYHRVSMISSTKILRARVIEVAGGIAKLDNGYSFYAESDTGRSKWRRFSAGIEFAPSEACKLLDEEGRNLIENQREYHQLRKWWGLYKKGDKSFRELAALKKFVTNGHKGIAMATTIEND